MRLKERLASYRSPLFFDNEKAQARLEQIRQKRALLVEQKKALLKVETAARQRLQEQINSIAEPLSFTEAKLAKLKKREWDFLHWVREQGREPELIDMSFLRMTKKQDGQTVPVFAAFQPSNDATFTIQARSWGWNLASFKSGTRLTIYVGGYYDNYPLDKYYYNEELFPETSPFSNRTNSFSFAFDGVFPDDRRDFIKELGKKRLFRLFLVMEVPKWEFTKEVAIQVGLDDPLVIGTPGGDTFFLLDEFDLTDTERLIAEEWTNKIDMS